MGLVGLEVFIYFLDNRTGDGFRGIIELANQTGILVNGKGDFRFFPFSGAMGIKFSQEMEVRKNLLGEKFEE